MNECSKRRAGFTGFSALFFACWILLAVATFPQKAWSSGACYCTAAHTCSPQECSDASDTIRDNHEDGEVEILKFIQEEFNAYRDWITDWDPGCPRTLTGKCRDVIPSFFRGYVLPNWMMMTEQMSAVAMQQAFIVGTMIDAKNQMETQRLFQELKAKAQEDYQPSEDFCYFGTNVRSMLHSEQRGHLNSTALSQRQMARHLGSAANPKVGVAGSFDRSDDRAARWEQFVKNYCDGEDNDYKGTSTGLYAACIGGGARTNNDIDFSKTIERPRTLNVDFSNGTLANDANGAPRLDEQDVFALSSNLYGHDVLTREVDEQSIKDFSVQNLYMALRSIAAKRAVAENSFNAIVGLKSAGTTDVGSPGAQTRNFLYAVMKELGVPEQDIMGMIGENPSYYAQLEVVAKSVYQNTDFYTDLYDTPANIDRKEVALKGIGLMLDRAIYESELRQEMATSVLLAAELYEGSFRKLGEKFINVEPR